MNVFAQSMTELSMVLFTLKETTLSICKSQTIVHFAPQKREKFKIHNKYFNQLY